MDSLAIRLTSWNEARLAEQANAHQAVTAHLNHCCYVNEQHVKYLQRLRALDEEVCAPPVPCHACGADACGART
jgi:hypothetical protein